MHPQAYSSLTRTSKPSWRCLLCWMLCLSVWRGPIPVLHSHSLAIADLGANESLAEHAVRFHADHLGEPHTGLHIHFLVLSPCEGSLLSPTVQHGNDVAPEATLCYDASNTNANAFWLEPVELAALDQTPLETLPIRCLGESIEGTFAISLLSQSPLIASLGVALI